MQTSKLKTISRWVLIPMPFLGFFFLLNSFIAPPPTMSEAIKKGLISTAIDSNGKTSYREIHMTVKNQTKSDQRILIPAGTTYLPNDPNEQELIQLEDEILTLRGLEEKELIIKTYCTELSDRCPDGVFKLGQNNNEELSELITFIKNNPTDEIAFQDAVWAITDKEDISTMPNDSHEDRTFRSHVANLSGQENTWYTSPSRNSIDPLGNINRETVQISGELSFEAGRPMRVHEEIQNAFGNTIIKSENHMQLRGGNVTYQFNIRVRGWQKGVYYVKVLNDSREALITKAFRV
jgi:hypothetical protein